LSSMRWTIALLACGSLSAFKPLYVSHQSRGRTEPAMPPMACEGNSKQIVKRPIPSPENLAVRALFSVVRAGLKLNERYDVLLIPFALVDLAAERAIAASQDRAARAEENARLKPRWVVSSEGTAVSTASWQEAAAVVAEAAAEAAEMAQLAQAAEAAETAQLPEACEEDTRDDTLSNEEEAKRRWLASLDSPSWGKAAAGVAAVAAEAAETAQLSEACEAVEEEEETFSQEQEAKQRWLASLDAPTWGKAATGVAAAAAQAAGAAQLGEACEESEEQACDTLSEEEEAKRRWLASLDAPSWGKAASVLAAVAAEAAETAQLSEECDEGEEEACETLRTEEEAKRRWLARLAEAKRFGVK